LNFYFFNLIKIAIASKIITIPTAIRQILNEFDIVTTFDEQDAAQYSMLHFTDPYAKRNVIPDDNIQKCDVFFIGADKGRGKLLNEIQKLFLNNNINSNLRVVGLPSELEMEGLYCQKEYMCYEQTIKNVLNSNCLLEVLCEGQHSSSLRYYEAVVYNKKLLTNNANIVNMSYYNPDYIKVFQKVSDIDVNWIKDDRDVNYNYNGDFSITHFFDMIKEYDYNSNK